MNKIFNCLITAAILFTAHTESHAQAPTLGTTASFVLFTTTGAVGNTGISHITGNVGTNTGAITGFGNVNGNMENSNGVTAQCAADLLIAYNQLNSTIPNFFLSTLLGNGDTLTAGVYQTPAATTLSGDLTLNALGDSNAVFVMLIQGPLSTSAGAALKLINGAQACNVYWKVEGLVSMASNTQFKGTLIANNAAITLSPNDTLEGRLFSTTGAINVNGVQAYIPTGCGSPILTGPAAPNLGSVACYSLFSGNGAVTNAGITYSAGDIGTNVGLAVGYNPLFVTGMIHPIPDLSTAAAAADLSNVYTYLNGLPTDIELMFPAQFGFDLVLTPHTYQMSSAVTFNGSVYLDARGNPDAVFVIKVNGAFSTGTFSKVILTNGAQAQNVFWKIDGAVNIADYSVFNGTMVANMGAIELTIGDTINGRMLTTTGALNSASIFITSPVVCFLLPVNWLYFNGQAMGNKVVLDWATENELNNDYFTIEKSMDGVQFKTLTTIDAAEETKGMQHKYSTTDLHPYPMTYYRISQTDIDGNKVAYKTIPVSIGGSSHESVVSHVEGDRIIIQTSGLAAGNGQIELYTMDGKRISSKQVALTHDIATYQIERPLQQGIYLIHIRNAKQTIHTGKILVF